MKPQKLHLPILFQYTETFSVCPCSAEMQFTPTLLNVGIARAFEPLRSHRMPLNALRDM